MLFCFFMDTLHSDILDCPESLGATINQYYLYIILISRYHIRSILQYTDLPVYCDSPSLKASQSDKKQVSQTYFADYFYCLFTYIFLFTDIHYLMML